MPDIDYCRLRSAMTDAATAFVNNLHPELPPIRWHYNDDWRGLSGIVDEVEYTDTEAVAQQWRAALGLADGFTYVSGYRAFLGPPEGEPCVVWYVTDREVFERDGRASCTPDD